MSGSSASILLLGESGVGKTHYGAQLLKRLMVVNGKLRMNGAAINLEPFEAALERLSEGMAADHTPTSTYVESIWPLADDHGRKGELIWPDYGGEQIKEILASRRLPSAWKARLTATSAWLLMIRLQQTRVSEDVFSRPLAKLSGIKEENHAVQVSDQARLIELLQILLYAGGVTTDQQIEKPHLSVLLTCWDELATESRPLDILRQQLPMFCDFVMCNWARPDVVGLSALGRPLNPRDRDDDYAAQGPETFGYVVLQDGTRSADLTLPIKMLLSHLA